MQYSFKLGIWKGIKSAAMIGAAMVVFAGLSDLNVWDLAVKYLKPVLEVMTVGGVFKMIVNYAKIKSATE